MSSEYYIVRYQELVDYGNGRPSYVTQTEKCDDLLDALTYLKGLHEKSLQDKLVWAHSCGDYRPLIKFCTGDGIIMITETPYVLDEEQHKAIDIALSNVERRHETNKKKRQQKELAEKQAMFEKLKKELAQ